jgi:hypothetical protein
MNRRLFLASAAMTGLAACTTTASPLITAITPGSEALDLEAAAAEAWLYSVMLVENAGSRAGAMADMAVNQLFHARVLTTVKTQFVTTPNNDTLYSRAWIDLNGGPVTLHMPAAGKRYVSYAFMDMYGNNFAILGTRTTGGEAHTVTLVGPNAANADPLALRAPTPWVWLLIRTLIDGDADLPGANAIQDAMWLKAPARPRPPKYETRNAAWQDYFTTAQALLAENPPPVSDLGFFQRIARLGLGPTSGFDASKFSAADAAKIEAGIAKAKTIVATQRSGAIRNGWVYPRASLGNFGQDYAYRAQIAIGGLGALTPAEAMYMRPVAADTTAFSSDRNWVLRFTREQLPPVNSFWSLTSYVRTPDGQNFFFDNPINRYAIGDRTSGLKYGADGSLEIYIQRSDPGGQHSSNWLPAPPAGPVTLVMRTYLPKPALLDGQYVLPALTSA